MSEQPKPSQYSILRIGDAKTIQLVELYRAEPCLWNSSHPDYHSRPARAAAAERIAAKLRVRNFKARHVLIKFQNLRNSYCQKLKKIRKGSKPGEVYKPRMPWYPMMDSFIRPYLQPVRDMSLHPDPVCNEMLEEEVILKTEGESERDEEDTEENNRYEEEEEATGLEKAVQTEPTPPRSQSHKRIKGPPWRSRSNQCTNVNQCCRKSTRQLLHSISHNVETLAKGDAFDAFDAFGRYVAAMLRAQPARAAHLQPRVVTLLTAAAAPAQPERGGCSATRRRQRTTKNNTRVAQSDESTDEISD